MQVPQLLLNTGTFGSNLLTFLPGRQVRIVLEKSATRTTTTSSKKANAGRGRNHGNTDLSKRKRTLDVADTNQGQKKHRTRALGIDDTPKVEDLGEEKEVHVYFFDYDADADHSDSSTDESLNETETTSAPETANHGVFSLRKWVEDEIQRAYDDRMAQFNVYHAQCRTCPICRCEFVGGRYYMLHHLFHEQECTKEVPMAVMNKLIEAKEAQDGVEYDDDGIPL